MGRALKKSPAPRRLAVVAALATGLGMAAAGCSAGQVTQTDTQVAAVNGASGQVGDVAVRDAQFLFPASHGAYEAGEDVPITVLIANNGSGPDKLLAVTSEGSAPAQITGDVELEAASSVLAEADHEEGGSHGTTTAKPSESASASASASPSLTTAPSAPVSTTGAATTTGSAPTTTTGSPTGTTTPGGGTSISNPPTTGTKLPSSVEPTEPGKVKIVLKGLKKPLRPGETIRVTFLFEKAGELTLELPIGATSEPRKDAPSDH
ncbi:copper chaperone PCu(A)C [Saccharothrix hoggarensis]|uniref:Copper(I)-binding protein n=1 Tax=Saccharothrix hoggarensis TaxID=913853 RepID=A0ABW3QUZ7_9PSEU